MLPSDVFCTQCINNCGFLGVNILFRSKVAEYFSPKLIRQQDTLSERATWHSCWRSVGLSVQLQAWSSARRAVNFKPSNEIGFRAEKVFHGCETRAVSPGVSPGVSLFVLLLLSLRVPKGLVCDQNSKSMTQASEALQTGCDERHAIACISPVRPNDSPEPFDHGM